MDDPLTAAEAAARALGYRLDPVTIRHPRAGTTVQMWGVQRIRQPHQGEHWLSFGTPQLHDSKPAALRALLARLDASPLPEDR